MTKLNEEVLDLFIGIIDALDSRKFKKTEQLEMAHDLVSRFLNAKTGILTMSECDACRMPETTGED